MDAAFLELPQDLARWIGVESEPIRAPGPIEWSDVRRYMNAAGDTNPEWGVAGGRDPSRVGALAPPAMILDVLRPGPGRDGAGESGDRPFPSPAGLASAIVVPGERVRLNAGTDIEWLRPLRIGDWVTVVLKITGIERKETPMGSGVFITEERRYFDQAGEPIATSRQTTVRLLSASATTGS